MYKNLNYIYKSEFGPKAIDYKVIYKIFPNSKNDPIEIYKSMYAIYKKWIQTIIYKKIICHAL